MAGIILKSCKWPLSSSDSASSCLNPPCYREKIQTTATALEAYWAENESRIPVFRVGARQWLPAQDEILLSLHESVPISRNIKASTRWAVITHRLIEKTSQDRTVTAVKNRFRHRIKIQKPRSTTLAPSKSMSPELPLEQTIEEITIFPSASHKRKQLATASISESASKELRVQQSNGVHGVQAVTFNEQLALASIPECASEELREVQQSNGIHTAQTVPNIDSTV